MTALWPILRLIWRERATAMRRGLALSVIVAVCGIALLALSGWFIVAAGVAGLAGTGAMFDVFRPSAGVRFLAMARTASRYGERLLTHDATLRALASLRVQVLSGVSGADFQTLSKLRGGQALNRLTADVDAMDGLAIRLVFPTLAGLIAAAGAFVAMWLLVTPAVAIWAVATPVLGGLAVLCWSGHAALAPSAQAETRHQALRAGVIDHLRARDLLAVAGRLTQARDALFALDALAREAALRQARVEWQAAAALQGVAAVTLAGVLWLAGRAVHGGQIVAAQAALAVLATLALVELAAALQRGAAELGRMRDAARRLAPLIGRTDAGEAGWGGVQGLHLSGLSVAALPGLRAVVEDLDLIVAPGETVALTGASGRGKTAVLNTAAGLLPPVAGRVRASAAPGYLPQRPALIAGTLREVLALAAPDADDAAMRDALAACALPLGLDDRLGEGGAGLSGGQARRLALARVVIQKPQVLLLDEPTEGLDAATAEAALRGIRAYLPECAILIAAHRPTERRLADRIVSL